MHGCVVLQIIYRILGLFVLVTPSPEPINHQDSKSFCKRMVWDIKFFHESGPYIFGRMVIKMCLGFIFVWSFCKHVCSETSANVLVCKASHLPRPLIQAPMKKGPVYCNFSGNCFGWGCQFSQAKTGTLRHFPTTQNSSLTSIPWDSQEYSSQVLSLPV